MVTNTATDPDVPANTLTFSLVSAPPGINLDSSTGILTWTPTEAQGPGSYPITIRVTDNGSPSMSDTKGFTVTVNEVNSPPGIPSIGDQSALPGAQLKLTIVATDTDLPANLLTFSLDSGAPAGAVIDPTTGVFTWTLPTNQVPGTYPVTVRVTDDGVPSMSNTMSFNITVVPPPLIESVAASGGNVTIVWSAVSGRAYRVQFKTDLKTATWNDVAGDVTATDATATKTDAAVSGSERFYRVMLLP